MSIQYKAGNMFMSYADVLVNAVNQQGVMGAGLAKQFKSKYPDMFESYLRFSNKGGWRRGIYIRVPVSDGFRAKLVFLHFYLISGNRMIVNLPTKSDWRKPSDMKMVEGAIKDFADFCKAREIKSAAVPRLGCGLGGLKWSQVKPIMVKEFEPLSTDVEIWSL